MRASGTAMGKLHPRQTKTADGRLAACVVEAAGAACRERGLPFTAPRKSVLEILLKQGRPIGAYDVLRQMQRHTRRRISPPTVYRALDFLAEQGFISKIESKSLFVPCARADHKHTCVFFICENCGSLTEIENPQLEQLFVRDASSLGFRVSKRVVELEGTCSNCLASP
jgi:Fur family zinc uptake transcriptional regulator